MESSRSGQGSNHRNYFQDGFSKRDHGNRGGKRKGKPGNGHRFPYGQCTWYVSQQRYVPWSGNAGTWLGHAKSFGYSTGDTPKKNAIAVFGGNRFGHVALVTNVNGDRMTISEMNYKGFGQVDSRVVKVGNPTLKGFIY